MRAQLSRLCAGCDVSRVKRPSKRMVTALKSCMMSGAGGDWASGGEWITVTRGKGLEARLPVAVLSVDGLVRQIQVMPARVRR